MMATNSPAARVDHLTIVKRYANALLSRGRNGSPLFSVLLDRKRTRPFRNIGPGRAVNLREPLFGLPLHHIATLDESILSADMRRAFRENGVRLSRSARVFKEGPTRFLFPGESNAREQVESWRIMDETAKRTYTIVLDDVSHELSVFFEFINGFDKSDRHAMRHAANPMLDQNLYQVLYALTAITGNPRYASGASSALQRFFQTARCSPDDTALLAWGDHLGWNVRTSTPTDVQPERIGSTHEFSRPWVLWERSLLLAPDEVFEYAHDLWTVQVGELQRRLSDADADRFAVPRGSAYFSRHVFCDGTIAEEFAEFPRHGGFFIAAWASVVNQYADPELLAAINELANFYDSRRFDVSATPASRPNFLGAIRFQTASRDVVPAQNLSLAIDLWESAAKVHDHQTAESLRTIALKTDAVLTRDDLSNPGKNYWLDAMLVVPTSGEYHQLWPDHSSRATSQAALGMMLWSRWGALRATHPSIAAVYEDYSVGVARSYIEAIADSAFVDQLKDEATPPVIPKTFGNAILLLLEIYEETRDSMYLTGARSLASAALDIFFDRGFRLPKASNRNEQYEALTGANTLMMGLLKLWLVENAPHLSVKLEFSDR